MFRALMATAVSLIFLSWPASAWDGTNEREEGASEAIAPTAAVPSQVQRLRGQLQRHRALAVAGGWPKVPDGPTLRPDAKDPRLEPLVRRLVVAGDLSGDVASISTPEYNENLQAAIRRFQARHGLEVDGLVGRKTLRALNVPIEKRIDQIRVNLDRARRLSDDQSDNFVLVNIAAYEAHVIRGGEKIWTAKIIVGEKEDETPEFRSTLKDVVFNPTWTVPFSIASEEMLPRIKEDSEFFVNGGYQLFNRDGDEVDPASVDWSVIGKGSFPFTLVQQPGPLNQLGQIKFMFPNEYSVCMHDTPARGLFAKAARAFSHGCIRVDEPDSFAEILLSSQGWTREQIDVQLDSDETRIVSLSKPLPILVRYWTAEVDDSGRIHFYEDIYERDAAILKALGRHLPSDHP